jgi:hypothetical protein
VRSWVVRFVPPSFRLTALSAISPATPAEQSVAPGMPEGLRTDIGKDGWLH